MRVEQTNPWLAVEPVGDRLAQARALRRLNEAFQAGKDVGGRVRAVVKRSWARSADAGIDPTGHLARIVVDESEIDERWSRHPLYPVLPMLRDLLSGATSESSHMLAISDARGILMWIEGHERVIEATHDMHFVCGADWSESGAGTNALGTAIAVDHPVQIFSAEHFNRIVHPWQCSGAPIHDPATGEILGVVDLTGHLRSAHPHTLALVTAAAGMAEAYLRHDQLRRDAVLREAYLERIAGVTQPTALVRPSGHVIAAVPHGWLNAGVGAPHAGGELALADGTTADVEALDGLDAFVVWGRRTGERQPRAPAGVRLELLGDRPRILLRGGPLELSARHAEILAVLMLVGRGMTAEELTLEVYGEAGKQVTLRAELSRLRRDLGGLLGTRPYTLAAPVTSDLHDAQRLLADGRLAEALALTGQGVMPRSQAPRIVEVRDVLEAGLREAIMRSGDPDLLAAWCHSRLGSDDASAANGLIGMLAPGDARTAAVRAHVARLDRRHAAQPGTA
jgi:hypothetical protein